LGLSGNAGDWAGGKALKAKAWICTAEGVAGVTALDGGFLLIIWGGLLVVREKAGSSPPLRGDSE